MAKIATERVFGHDGSSSRHGKSSRANDDVSLLSLQLALHLEASRRADTNICIPYVPNDEEEKKKRIRSAIAFRSKRSS